MRIYNKYQGYQYIDRNELKNEKECNFCQTPNPDLEKFPWCQTCGAYLSDLDDWENWDQTNYLYTDEKLKEFARNGTNYLLEEEYNKMKSWKYTVAEVQEKTEEGTSYFEGSASNKGGTIYYQFDQLRKKRSCGNFVAHESAHASPRALLGWDKIESEKWFDPLYYIRQRKLAGHHDDWRPIWHEFREKIRNQFPEYWGE